MVARPLHRPRPRFGGSRAGKTGRLAGQERFHRTLLRLQEPLRPGQSHRAGLGCLVLPALLAESRHPRGPQPQGNRGDRGMSASESRFVAIWASHEARARLWLRLLVLTAAGLVLSLVTTIRVWNRPREVVRIGCDGIPQLVTLDSAAYSEPNEREIRAFATA